MYLNLEHLRQRGWKKIAKTTVGKWRRTGSSLSRHFPWRLCACWQTEMHSESEIYSEPCQPKPCLLPVQYVSNHLFIDKTLVMYHVLCLYSPIFTLVSALNLFSSDFWKKNMWLHGCGGCVTYLYFSINFNALRKTAFLFSVCEQELKLTDSFSQCTVVVRMSLLTGLHSVFCVSVCVY